MNIAAGIPIGYALGRASRQKDSEPLSNKILAYGPDDLIEITNLGSERPEFIRRSDGARLLLINGEFVRFDADR